MSILKLILKSYYFFEIKKSVAAESSTQLRMHANVEYFKSAIPNREATAIVDRWALHGPLSPGRHRCTHATSQQPEHAAARRHFSSRSGLDGTGRFTGSIKNRPVRPVFSGPIA